MQLPMEVPPYARILPARLVFKGRAWYLQGFCLDNRDYRTFRLSRILELTVTEERFDLSLSPPANRGRPLVFLPLHPAAAALFSSCGLSGL